MQKIVDEVLSAEREAKKIVEAARRRAGEQKSAIETEIAEKLKQAREEAQEIVKTGIEAARSKAEEKYRLVIEEAEKESETFFRENTRKIENLIDKVADLIIIPEINRE